MPKKQVRRSTKTIGVNMNEQMVRELEKRAKSMHLSTSHYCRLILLEWLNSGKKLVLKEQD